RPSRPSRRAPPIEGHGGARCGARGPRRRGAPRQPANRGLAMMLASRAERARGRLAGASVAGPPRARSAGRAAAPEIEAQRTALAARHRPAVGLAHTDEERVIFVEQHGIGWQTCLEERARLVVARPAPE